MVFLGIGAVKLGSECRTVTQEGETVCFCNNGG